MQTLNQSMISENRWLMHAWRGFRLMKEKAALLFREACSKSSRLSSLYYRFSAEEFSREQQVVLRGIVAYNQERR